MHEAAAAGHADCVQQLLQSGPPPDPIAAAGQGHPCGSTAASPLLELDARDDRVPLASTRAHADEDVQLAGGSPNEPSGTRRPSSAAVAVGFDG